MRNLSQSPIQTSLTILDVVGDPLLTRRLREMGFHSGCEVRLLGQAPFGGPFVVQLHDSVLALRKAEAECLLIK
jgi:ferrous iron transport protein A